MEKPGATRVVQTCFPCTHQRINGVARNINQRINGVPPNITRVEPCIISYLNATSVAIYDTSDIIGKCTDDNPVDECAHYPLREELGALCELVEIIRTDFLQTSMIVRYIQDYLRKYK